MRPYIRPLVVTAVSGATGMTTLFAGAHVAAAATPDGVAAAPAAPAPPPAPAPAQLAAAITPAVANTHTVVSGDTLSGISQSAYGTASQWPNIYNANRPLIGADPNMIVPGQVLTVPSGAGLTASVTPAPDPAPAPVHYSAPAPAPVHHAAPASAPVHSSAGGSWSWPWSCIAQYESGGNPAANTGNGYYGGLQFSLSTWRAYGGVGNPANASIAEQEAVANRVLAGQGWGAWPNTSRRCGL